MPDAVRIWSDELAHDPSSLVFLPLAETLRQRGQLEMARKVALRGLERHPMNPDAHDQLARICVDAGEWQQALEEWEMVRRILPTHVGAIKGIAFVRFQQGDRAEAERLLIEAHGLEIDNADISAAITTVRRVTPSGVDAAPPSREPAALFADILAQDQTALLLDTDGRPVGGAYHAADGRDVAADVGAALSGVSGEAQRATRHLGIGAWRAVVFETESAIVSFTPAPATGAVAGGVIVLSAPPATPLGMLRRLLDQCSERVEQRFGGGAA